MKYKIGSQQRLINRELSILLLNLRREKRTPEDPWTPPKNIKYSRRAFDGLIKVWRKKLHCYDPEGANRQRNDLEEASE